MIASERTINNKKIMLSSAGTEPVDGKLILMRPENPAPFTLSIASDGSLATASHDVSSITSVKEPAVVLMFEMVKLIAVGVGV